MLQRADAHARTPAVSRHQASECGACLWRVGSSIVPAARRVPSGRLNRGCTNAVKPHMYRQNDHCEGYNVMGALTFTKPAVHAQQ